MPDTLIHLAHRVRSEDGFVIGRVAVVVPVLAISIVAALAALIVPS